MGSTKLVTDRDGNPVQAPTQYYAYGRAQAPGRVDGLPTDYAFTGQRQDNTGLIYMNARYYDPELGEFISPDTLIPDPNNLFDYNRYMFVHGNPLRFHDPTGHATSKPDWWPDSLPYTFDLPDGMTKAQFIEWVSENNLPTTIGGQLGVDFNATAGAGVATSVEGGWLFNWWSGEFVYQGTSAAGLVASLSANLGIAGGHAGATWVASASSIRDSIKGYARYQSVSVQADAIAKAGLSVTTAKSIPANPANPDILFVSQMAETYMDPIFDRSVDTLALNVVGGLDPIPNGVDASYGAGFSKTETVGFNLYTPFVNFYNQWFH